MAPSPVPEWSRNDLCEVVAGASSLSERLRFPEAFAGSESFTSQAKARLALWRETAGEASDARLRQRWSFDNLDETAVRRVLGPATAPAAFPLPEWAEVLTEVLGMPNPTVMRDSDRLISGAFPFLDSARPVPFEEAFLSFIMVGIARIEATDRNYRSLPRTVRAAFERSLLRKLSGIGARVLTVEFHTFVACRQLASFPYPAPIRGRGSREAYSAFVKELATGGWPALFREYCAMARLLAVCVLQWVNFVAEFSGDLAADLSEIGAQLCGGAGPGELAEIKTDLSDSHDGGRSVVALTFASGARVIYKPKPLGLDAEYFRLVEWLNRLGATPPFRVLRILDRGRYGWMEFVAHEPCESEAAVRRFYRRAGILLCLIYALNGIDFHCDNVIAAGEHPIPVDLETVYHHLAEESAGDPGLADIVSRRMRDSVLSTDILANPAKDKGRPLDISALARSAEEEVEVETLSWREINTDAMAYDFGPAKLAPSANLPSLGGCSRAPDEYVDEVLAGFRETYEMLCRHREKLIAEGSPLRRLFAHPARFVFRSTTWYSAVMKRAFHPDSLRSGVDFGIQLDVLSCRFSGERQVSRRWPLVRAETDALWQGDIPRFSASGDGTAMTLPSGECVRGCFTEPAWDRARRKIVGFGDEDLAWQIRLIKGSMDARDASRPATGTPEDEVAEADVLPLTAVDLLARAKRLACTLLDSAVYGDDGEPGWLVLKYSPEHEQIALRPMDLDLYNGRVGVALFFAALEKVSPREGFGETARSLLALPKRFLEKADLLPSLGLGGLIGLPSLIYAFTRIGALLNDRALVAEAVRAAGGITTAAIAADRALDIVGGAAGAILVLLACHEESGEPRLLETAAACGRHVLAKRQKLPQGGSAWPTLRGKHLTGMSHGAAGIAYALAKLAWATGEGIFMEAASGGIEFEKRLLSSTEKNWAREAPQGGNEKADRKPPPMLRWCHGAPGIGLARLGNLRAWDTPEIRQDIEMALESTRSGALPRGDHLCCGSMGWTETFLTAGRTLGDSKWSEEAWRLASRVAARADRRGCFGVVFRHGFSNPGLFRGAAGIGYQMLRIAFPELIPAVLLLE